MNESEKIWKLVQEAPFAEPPVWLATRTLARLRRTREERRHGQLIWRWAAGSVAALALAAVALGFYWQQHRSHDQALTFAALELAEHGGWQGSEEDVWLAAGR